MRFQTIDPSKSDGGKLNSQQYQILQTSLAYYGAHIYEPPRIADLLDDCGLISGDFAHPFLSKLQLKQNPDKYSGLLSFYQGVMWPFRRHYWDLGDERKGLLAHIFSHSPVLKQAWLLRHELFLIYESDDSLEEADQRFKDWVDKVQRSELTCFGAFIQLLDNNRQGILAYFNGRYNSGFVEGLNNKLKVIKRRCYGLLDAGRLFQRIQIDLQDRMGLLKSSENTTCCG